MKKRKIIKIIDEKCDGCGLCANGCPEGAIKIIDGKARLVSEIFCDGLGACVGDCPKNAIITEERFAEPYDEIKTLENIMKHGLNTLKAHLKHLKDHGQEKYYKQAMEYLKKKNIVLPEEKKAGCGCPSAKPLTLKIKKESQKKFGEKIGSRLAQWPVQLHLISPQAPYFQGADLLVTADCCAFSYGDFHRDFINGKAIVIACPKLDSDKDIYIDKLLALIDSAKVKSIEIVTMEVPCCMGLMALVNEALSQAESKPEIKHTVIGIRGDIK